MTGALKEFLQFLRLNRNMSPHTIRAYESDISQFLASAAASAGVKRGGLSASQLDRAQSQSTVRHPPGIFRQLPHCSHLAFLVDADPRAGADSVDAVLRLRHALSEHRRLRMGQ